MCAANESVEHLGVKIEGLTRPHPFLAEWCDGFDTSASQGAGAAYTWCRKILNTAARVRKKFRAHSFGIYTFDCWSQVLSNKYGLTPDLYDCYFTAPLRGSYAQYRTNRTRHDVCLGDETKVDQHNRSFQTLETTLETHSPLSTFLKMDIEGWEWRALAAVSTEELDKIALLDLELHWCTPPTNPLLIVPVLQRLMRQFFVVARLHGRKDMHYAATGCRDSTTTYTMMSISYVNRAFF